MDAVPFLRRLGAGGAAWMDAVGVAEYKRGE
jgi:hypothetical protein